MTRTPHQPGASNYDASGSSPVQFYEQRYTAIGGNEWIFAPDAESMFVTLFFPSGGSAFIEGTDEPPGDIMHTVSTTGNPVFNAQHYYPVTDTVTDTTRVEVRGCTAIRVNLLGGSCDVTVRV